MNEDEQFRLAVEDVTARIRQMFEAEDGECTGDHHYQIERVYAVDGPKRVYDLICVQCGDVRTAELE